MSCPSFCGVVSCGAVRSFEHIAVVVPGVIQVPGTIYYVRVLFLSHVLPFRTWHQQASSAGQLALHKHLFLATFFHRSSFSLLSSTLYWFFHFVNNYYCIFFVFQLFLRSFSTVSFKFDSFELVFQVLNIFLTFFIFVYFFFLRDLFLGVELATSLFWELNLHFNGRPCEGVELAF